MTDMETALGQLSPEELNALNTDPELLSAFKTKYGTHGHETLQAMTPQQKSIEQEGSGLIDQGLGGLDNQDIQKAGQDAAEAIGAKGYPNTGAAVGTVIQMAPDIAMATMGGGVGDARAAAQAGKLGQIGRIISGPGRAEAGAAVSAAEQAAGVHPDILPTLRDAAANLGLKTVDKKTYLNALMSRLQSGEDMSAQALSQHHKMITDLLSQEPTGFGKMLNGSKLGSPAVAQATRADQLIKQRLNDLAPGRADAAANYSAAKAREKIYTAAALTGLGLAGKNALLSAFDRLTGGR